jgi:hypothetical protein
MICATAWVPVPKLCLGHALDVEVFTAHHLKRHLCDVIAKVCLHALGQAPHAHNLATRLQPKASNLCR